MRSLLPSAGALPRSSIPSCLPSRPCQQLSSSTTKRNGVKACAGDRKYSLQELLAPSPYPNEPSSGEADDSDRRDVQQRRQTLESLSALFTAAAQTEANARTAREPPRLSSREEDLKRREHASRKGLLGMLFEEDEITVGKADQAAHAPKPPPSANRLYTDMRKQGSSMASLLHFVLQYNDQLGPKHCVLAWKLMANICSQQPSSSGASSSTDMQCSSSSMAPEEAAAHARLLDMLKQRLSSCMDQLDAHQTTLVLWSSGSMQLRDMALLPGLLQHVQPLLGELALGELSSVVWACAKLGLDDVEFMAASEAAAAAALAASAAAEASSLARGSVPGGFNNRQYLERVTENQQLCDMAWSLAVLNRYSSGVFQALLSTYSRRFDTLRASMLVTILWSMNKVAHQDPTFARQALTQVCGEVHKLELNQLAMLISYLMGTMDLADRNTQASAGGGVSSSGSSSSKSSSSSSKSSSSWSSSRSSSRSSSHGGSSSAFGSSRSSSGSPGAALPVRNVQALTRSCLQLAVAELRWKLVCRQNRQYAALDAFSETEVVDAMRAVVVLNQRVPGSRSSSSSNSRPPAAGVGRGRLGYVNPDWLQQQQRWQQQWQHELADSKSFDPRFAPVSLALYDDVVLLRMLMDRSMIQLPGLRPGQLLQLLSVCARVGFKPSRLVPEAVKLLRQVKASLSTEELRVASWALASAGGEDAGAL